MKGMQYGSFTPHWKGLLWWAAETANRSRKPRIGSMVVEDYLRPAAIRTGVLEVKDGATSP
jgi:hypothetical protein